MKFYDTLVPYRVLDHHMIEYGVCRDFDHISRYRGLRQLVHMPDVPDERFVALETPNNIHATNLDVTYYEVPYSEENRLDIIASKFLGSSNYKWVIAYFNDIEDGYTVISGTKLKIPKSITSLFNTGELLQSVNPTQLNLGSE